MTLAAEIATSRPETVDLDDTVFEAAKRMRDAGVGDVLVLEDDRLCGIITDRDVVVRVLAEKKNPKTTKVKDVCSSNLATVAAMDSLEKAEEVMRERAVRRLPVVDRDGDLVGVVSIDDIVEREHPDSEFAGVLRAHARA